MDTTATPTHRLAARLWRSSRARVAPAPWRLRTVASVPTDAPELRAWRVEVFRAGHPDVPARRSAGISYRRADADAVAAAALRRLADPRCDPAAITELFTVPRFGPR